MKNNQEPPDMPVAFVYILTKARLYLKMGENVYRKHDALHMPLAEWPEELRARVRTGLEQISAFRGYAPDKPLEGLDVDGFYALMATFHFGMEQQKASFLAQGVILDEMTMRHHMTGMMLVLYNKVVTGG